MKEVTLKSQFVTSNQKMPMRYAQGGLLTSNFPISTNESTDYIPYSYYRDYISTTTTLIKDFAESFDAWFGRQHKKEFYLASHSKKKRIRKKYLDRLRKSYDNIRISDYITQ